MTSSAILADAFLFTVFAKEAIQTSLTASPALPSAATWALSSQPIKNGAWEVSLPDYKVSNPLPSMVSEGYISPGHAQFAGCTHIHQDTEEIAHLLIVPVLRGS